MRGAGMGWESPAPESTLLPHWMLILDPATYDYLGYKVYNQSISLEAYGVVDRIGQRP
jgi:hypothetical protein